VTRREAAGNEVEAVPFFALDRPRRDAVEPGGFHALKPGAKASGTVPLYEGPSLEGDGTPLGRVWENPTDEVLLPGR